MLQFQVRIREKIESFANFLLSQQIAYLLFGVLAFGNILPRGHYSWPAWIMVVLLWIMTASALFFAVNIGIILPIQYFRGKLPELNADMKQWRVKLNAIFLGLGYVSITAWGIVSLTGHKPHYLTQAVFFIFMSWYYNSYIFAWRASEQNTQKTDAGPNDMREGDARSSC